MLEAIPLTSLQIESIKTLTKEQSSCQKWFDHRYGRLTASKNKRIVTKAQTCQNNPNTDTSSLVCAVMGYKKPPITVAMKHGIACELHAKRRFTKLMAGKHVTFSATESSS